LAKLEGFPDAKDIARSTGQPQLIWLIDELSQHVHTSRWALAYGVRETGEETVEVGFRSDAAQVVQAVTLAIAIFTAGALSAAILLDFDTADGMAQLRRELEVAFAAVAREAGLAQLWGHSDGAAR
jgi:hypothetical protein